MVEAVTAAARYVAEWARKAREATAARDRWVCTMRDEGATLQKIAEAAGMTHAGVARILRRRR